MTQFIHDNLLYDTEKSTLVSTRKYSWCGTSGIPCDETIQLYRTRGGRFFIVRTSFSRGEERRGLMRHLSIPSETDVRWQVVTPQHAIDEATKALGSALVAAKALKVRFQEA